MGEKNNFPPQRPLAPILNHLIAVTSEWLENEPNFRRELREGCCLDTHCPHKHRLHAHTHIHTRTVTQTKLSISVTVEWHCNQLMAADPTGLPWRWQVSEASKCFPLCHPPLMALMAVWITCQMGAQKVRHPCLDMLSFFKAELTGYSAWGPQWWCRNDFGRVQLIRNLLRLS